MYPVKPRKINKRYKNFSVDAVAKEIAEEAKINGIDLSKAQVEYMIVSFNEFVNKKMKQGVSFRIAYLGKFIPTKKRIKLEQEKKKNNDLYISRSRPLKKKLRSLDQAVYITKTIRQEAFEAFNKQRISQGKKPAKMYYFDRITNYSKTINEKEKQRKKLRVEIKRLE